MAIKLSSTTTSVLLFFHPGPPHLLLHPYKSAFIFPKHPFPHLAEAFTAPPIEFTELAIPVAICADSPRLDTKVISIPICVVVSHDPTILPDQNDTDTS